MNGNKVHVVASFRWKCITKAIQVPISGSPCAAKQKRINFSWNISIQLWVMSSSNRHWKINSIPTSLFNPGYANHNRDTVDRAYAKLSHTVTQSLNVSNICAYLSRNPLNDTLAVFPLASANAALLFLTAYHCFLHAYVRTCLLVRLQATRNSSLTLYRYLILTHR